jgi:hypothetical protein
MPPEQLPTVPGDCRADGGHRPRTPVTPRLELGARRARERAGERQRRVGAVRHVAAEDAAVVLRRRDDRPDAVGAALDVHDRVADGLLLEVDVVGALLVLGRVRRAGGVLGAGQLEAVLEERVGYSWLTKIRPSSLESFSGKNARKSLLYP